jgi:hypothetical protein
MDEDWGNALVSELLSLCWATRFWRQCRLFTRAGPHDWVSKLQGLCCSLHALMSGLAQRWRDGPRDARQGVASDGSDRESNDKDKSQSWSPQHSAASAAWAAAVRNTQVLSCAQVEGDVMRATSVWEVVKLARLISTCSPGSEENHTSHALLRDVHPEA